MQRVISEAVEVVQVRNNGDFDLGITCAGG